MAAKPASSRKPTVRTVAAAKAKPARFVVTRTKDGKLVINGVGEDKLVNRFPGISVQKAPGKGKLSSTVIDAIVKSMKVA